VSERADAPAVRVDPEVARAALQGRPIGPHLPISPGLSHAAERARLVGAGAIQVFADNPTAWRRRSEPPADLDAFRRGLEDARIGPLAIHASYLVNLASPAPALRDRSVETMAAELHTGARFGARFVNVHIGSHRGAGAAAGIERAGETLARILDAVPPDPETPRLVVEDSAGQGDAVGVSIEELGAILDAATRHGADPGRLGICLDTAHLWGAGYALDDPVAIDALLAEVDALVGSGRLAMIHLNDSSAPRGSRTDRHEHIGGGLIGARGLGHLLAHPGLRAVPTYLETPGMEAGWDAVNMDRVRRLLADRRLADLPAAAFLARTDRH
jgi:deoxyribonuclease-4